MAKGLSQSSTVRGAAIAGAISILAAVTPTVGKMLTRHFPSHRADVEDGVELVMQVLGVLGVSGAGMAIAGRIQAGGIYTPHWMPGPNEEDFEVHLSSGKKVVQNPDDAL